jgi:hypothetical protein
VFLALCAKLLFALERALLPAAAKISESGRMENHIFQHRARLTTNIPREIVSPSGSSFTSLPGFVTCENDRFIPTLLALSASKTARVTHLCDSLRAYSV